MRDAWRRRRRAGAAATNVERAGTALAERLEPRRLFAAGDLDPTFSGDGLVTTAVGASSGASDVIVQSDGKAIVAGFGRSSSGATTDAILVRYNSNGTLDSSFGTGGIARIDFGFNESFTQLALLPDGKIIAGGLQTSGKWMLARFTASGQRDAGSGFGGTDGVQIGDGRIDELALQGSNIISGSFALATNETVVRRHVGSTGAIDTAFGSGGSVVVSSIIPELADFHFMDDLVVQNDGKILVTGVAAGREGDPEEVGGDPLDFADRVMALGRLTANGAADSSFGIGGGVRKGLDNEGTSGHAIGVRASDGSIFVATTDGGPDADLLRISSAGAVQGVEPLPNASGGVMSAESILIDAFGNIVVAGRLHNPDTDTSDFAVTRFNADFTSDGSFGESGLRFVEFAPLGSPQGATDSLGAAALAPGGKIVLGGTTTDQSSQIAVARLDGHADPSAPAIAITGGVLVASGTGGNDTFTVRRTGGDDVIVTVNALSRTLDMDDFTGVRLEGFGGDDTFNLIDALVSPVVRNTTVFGGAGSDTVSYASRTEGLTINGYQEPDSAIAVPHLGVTANGQDDRLDNTVETIIGGSGDDNFRAQDPLGEWRQVFGLPASLRLEGRGGNDIFAAPLGVHAVMLGGAGADQFDVFQSASGVMNGGEGDDRYLLQGGGTLQGIIGGAGSDTLNVTSSTLAVIDMRQTPDVEDAFGVGANQGAGYTFFGNDLANEIIVQSDGEFGGTVRGQGGNDTLAGGAQAELLAGEGGNDILIGGPGDDTLDGGSGTDFADGNGGSNTHVSIEQFAVTSPSIFILDRVLTATGTGNADTITIERVLGDDVIVRVGSFSRQFDIDDFDTVLLRGLGGNDRISILDPITAGPITRRATLDGGSGNDSLTGNAGDDVLRGGAGADTLTGLAGDDSLDGQAGNDRLFGGTGLDFLDGGDDDDFLDASDGAAGDTVVGGNGNDSADVDAGDGTGGVESFV